MGYIVKNVHFCFWIFSDLNPNSSCFNSEVRIEGLETLDYLDNLCQRERFTEQGDAITFESEVNFSFLCRASWKGRNIFCNGGGGHLSSVETLFHLQVDRVYLSSSGCVAVLDHERKRTYVIKKEGLPDIGKSHFLSA